MQNKQQDLKVIYSLAHINTRIELAMRQADWGNFITPVSADPLSHHAAHFQTVDFTPCRGKSAQFDAIIQRMEQDANLKDHLRCSAKYYFDCFQTVNSHTGRIQKIVEVGPQFGDVSCLLAGTLNDLNATLDIVDIDPFNLYATYAAIQRHFPDVLQRVKFFLGDLPTYIKHVALHTTEKHLIHYQGSTTFNDVIRDLGATAFIKNQVYAVMVHNTHLRTTNMNDYSFADAALYALFGINMRFMKLGNEAIGETTPAAAAYFATNRADGYYIPYMSNIFRYPHPSCGLEALLYQPQELPAHALS